MNRHTDRLVLSFLGAHPFFLLLRSHSHAQIILGNDDATWGAIESGSDRATGILFHIATQ